MIYALSVDGKSWQLTTVPSLAPPAARSDSVDVRARRPSPLLPAGPCSATPPALRLLPCAPLDVGREDRFPLGTRLREDRARVVNAARARSPFSGTPVAVALPLPPLQA